jgi:hypothetical protein
MSIDEAVPDFSAVQPVNTVAIHSEGEPVGDSPRSWPSQVTDRCPRRRGTELRPSNFASSPPTVYTSQSSVFGPAICSKLRRFSTGPRAAEQMEDTVGSCQRPRNGAHGGPQCNACERL